MKMLRMKFTQNCRIASHTLQQDFSEVNSRSWEFPFDCSFPEIKASSNPSDADSRRIYIYTLKHQAQVEVFSEFQVFLPTHPVWL